MKDYNVLTEVATLVDELVIPKPDGACVSDDDWRQASEETRELHIQVEELGKPLLDAYWEAIRQRDFEQALHLYQVANRAPFMGSINRELYPEVECLGKEIEFIARAKAWIQDANELLRPSLWR